MEDSVADEEESIPEPENKEKEWSIHFYTLEYTGDEEDNAAGGAPG